MDDLISWLVGGKISQLLTASVGGAIAILLEFKRHTWATAGLALISGTFVAYVATTPIVEFWGWSTNAEHAVAGVLGISGRNLIVWILQVSKDPLQAWKRRR